MHNLLVGFVKRIFSASVRFGHSRSSKVIDFDIYRKRVCDFLLVRRSNLGHILPRFRDIAGVLVRNGSLIPPEFWGVPVGPERQCLGRPKREHLSNQP